MDILLKRKFGIQYLKYFSNQQFDIQYVERVSKTIEFVVQNVKTLFGILYVKKFSQMSQTVSIKLRTRFINVSNMFQKHVLDMS